MIIDNTSPVEWAFRLVQSMAFGIHGVLGVTEPFTGCVQGAFGDEHSAMPKWFWPVAGLLLWTVAVLNFSPNPVLVLCAQAYICAFHMGGFFYHLRLGHHFVVGFAPAVFAVFAFFVVGIRIQSFGLALLGWMVCTLVAYGLSRILVTPPPPNGDGVSSSTSNLLNANE